VTLTNAQMDVQGAPAEAKSIQIVIDVEQDARQETKSKDEMRSSELYYRIARLAPTIAAAADPRDREREKERDKRLEFLRKFQVEYWRRIAFGLSPLAFALLGVPMGLLVRRGSRAQAFVIALFIALPVYYPLLLWGDNLASMGRLPAALALNLANILLSAVGLVLLGRLVTR